MPKLIAEYTGPYKGHYPVLAKQPIPNGDVGIFYFEMKVISEFSHVYIGLGSKSMPLNQWPGRHVGTYAYGNREFWGHEAAGCSYNDPSTRRPYIGGKFSFEQDDVVGCGVNLKTSEIIYTLNGKPLKTTDLLVSSTADLFPCVWMYCPGNKIEANFGPTFLCDEKARGNISEFK
uniref:B30.2/SPRY domain-containing protein n=1 Tax=Globodera pallida TaxID=36090 RepID=A0A183C295_GLOPA